MNDHTMVKRYAGIAMLLGALVWACHSSPSTTGAPSALASVETPTPTPTPASCTLRPESAHLAASLPRPMTIDAYVTRGLPLLDEYVAELESLLRAYERESAGKIQVRVVEARDDVARGAAEHAGLQATPFASMTAAGAASIVQGFLGLAFDLGGERDALALSPADDVDVEMSIAIKLADMRDKMLGTKHRIGVLTGHGEVDLGDANLLPKALGTTSIREILAKSFPAYQLVPFDDTCEAVLVLQPAKTISRADLRRIDDAVMRGKPLAIFASAVNVEKGDASMYATLDWHGLDTLLAGYGIEAHTDAVVDFKNDYRVTMMTTTGTATAGFPALLDVHGDALDGRFPPLFRLERLVLPFASSLVLHPEKQPLARASVVASSPSSNALTSSRVDLSPFRRWKVDAAPKSVAVGIEIEGKLTSAFDAARSSSADARVFVLASSQITANPFTRRSDELDTLAQSYANMKTGALLSAIVMVKNTLAWMTSDAALLDAGKSASRCGPRKK